MIKRTLKRAYNAVLEARKKQAANHLATYLVERNSDFKHISQYDLAKMIANGTSTSDVLLKRIGEVK